MNESHYDEKYFEWQRKVGKFGGIANLFKFEEYIESDSDILDFGCGGGFLLSNIQTSGKKIGVEINPSARDVAKQNGIECFDDIKKVDENSIDILITNHALEYVDNPIMYICEFKRVVRNNGQVVIVVPHEVSDVVKVNDKNMHLFTWAPQNLYNLLTICGIEVIRCERLCHAWMPHYLEVQQEVGWEEFHRLCVLHSKETKQYQTIAVGKIVK